MRLFISKKNPALYRPVFHSYEQYYKSPVLLFIFWKIHTLCAYFILFNYQIVQINTKWKEILFCISTCYFSWHGFRFYGYFSNSVANFRPLVPQGLKVSTPIEKKWYVVPGEFIVSFLFVLFLQFSSFALLIDVERYIYTAQTFYYLHSTPYPLPVHGSCR